MALRFCIHMMILPVKLIKELQKMANWFQANKLPVNAEKTNYMLLGTRYGNTKYVESVAANKEIQSKSDDTNLQKVSSTKFLGAIIDEHPTCKNHIGEIE